MADGGMATGESQLDSEHGAGASPEDDDRGLPIFRPDATDGAGHSPLYSGQAADPAPELGWSERAPTTSASDLHRVEEQVSQSKLNPEALESYRQDRMIDPTLVDARDAPAVLEFEAKGSVRTSKVASGGTSPRRAQAALAIVFDITDLVHHFQKARLLADIQHMQVGIIRGVIAEGREDIGIHLVCHTRETGSWVQVPRPLFQTICKLALASGDAAAPEWVETLVDLRRVLQSRKQFQFPRDAILLNLGPARSLDNYFLNVRLAKSLSGVKYVPFVHDLIAAMAPEHCVDEVRKNFISWAAGAFDHADHFLCNSNATLKDLMAVGTRLGRTVPEAAVVTPDVDFNSSVEAGNEHLDADYVLYSRDLEKGEYVLFDAAIESRKNHIAVFSVWLKLLKKHGAKNMPRLVCVGSDGWLHDAAYAKLQASDLLSRRVVMLQKVSDAELAILYQNCLCTVFPSSYEGWALPVTKALSFGKVPIVAEGSSLPEAGGDFAEYFDLESEKDFLAKVERIVFDAEYRKRREHRIALEFRPRSWSDISKQVLVQLKEWRDRPQTERDPDLSTRINGVWPLGAALNELHPLTSTASAALWPGLQSGEMYRNGMGWWWPEPWGTWIKNTGPAHVAFVLEGINHSNIFIYLGLRGVQGKYSMCTVKTEGAASREIALNDRQDKVLKLILPPVTANKRLVVLSISCNGVAEFSQLTNGVDSRTAGVGVRWFYACREDDIVGRLNLLEALAVDDMDGLRRQPPAMFSDNPFAGLAMPQDKRDAMSEEGEVVLLMAAEG